jgi:hypothetical protein
MGDLDGELGLADAADAGGNGDRAWPDLEGAGDGAQLGVASGEERVGRELVEV